MVACVRVRLGLLIAVFMLAVAACGSDRSREPAANGGAREARPTIKIGVLVPLSGDNARFGTEMLNGAQLAAADLNAAGGVLGRDIEIVSGDDACDPDTAGASAEQLAATGIVGVAGGYCSGAAVPASAALSAKGEGYVATAALVPELLPRAGAFIQTYTERFGAAPGPSGVYEYDAVRTLANAIFWAGSTDPKDIIGALRTTRHEGLIGEIAFDAKGDRQSTLYTTAIVRDGKFRPHKKLDARDNWVDG